HHDAGADHDLARALAAADGGRRGRGDRGAGEDAAPAALRPDAGLFVQQTAAARCDDCAVEAASGGRDSGGNPLITRLQQLPMRHGWLRWAVLGAGLVFGAASAYYFYLQARDEASAEFRTVAIGAAHSLDTRIRANGDVLFALRGLFAASNKVTRDDFHEFAQAI